MVTFGRGIDVLAFSTPFAKIIIPFPNILINQVNQKPLVLNLAKSPDNVGR